MNMLSQQTRGPTTVFFHGAIKRHRDLSQMETRKDPSGGFSVFLNVSLKQQRQWGNFFTSKQTCNKKSSKKHRHKKLDQIAARR